MRADSVANRYTYTGREIDSETGLMYYRARWYDPQQGRFASSSYIRHPSSGSSENDRARDDWLAATHPNQTNESYTYDDVGNRTASHQGASYTYQPFNRLVAANGTSFGYDTNGNLTTKTDASGSWTYAWDYENRLKQASKSGGVAVTYAYDALGRRVQRTSTTGGTTKFVYDGADVMRDLDSAGNTVADYLNAPGIDKKLQQTISGTASYFLTDHLGTTHALADANGSIASNLAYDSFGNVITGSASTRYTYTGREFDSDSALIYYRARWYDPQRGRFASEDPIGFGSGLNWYSYVDSSPLNFTDSFGLCRDQEYCRKLLQQILDKTNGFFNAFRPYKDSGFVDVGGKPWRHGGQSGVSKPGGHYSQIIDRQRGLTRDLEDYMENCIKKGPPPPGLERAFDAMKTHVPWPANLPTIEELRMEEESNRQMAEFWRKLFLGSVGGAAIIVGGPEVIPALPRILWFIPALAP